MRTVLKFTYPSARPHWPGRDEMAASNLPPLNCSSMWGSSLWPCRRFSNFLVTWLLFFTSSVAPSPSCPNGKHKQLTGKINTTDRRYHTINSKSHSITSTCVLSYAVDQRVRTWVCKQLSNERGKLVFWVNPKLTVCSTEGPFLRLDGLASIKIQGPQMRYLTCIMTGPIGLFVPHEQANALIWSTPTGPSTFNSQR